MLATPSRAVVAVVLVVSLPVNEDAGLVSAIEAVVGILVFNGGF